MIDEFRRSLSLIRAIDNDGLASEGGEPPQVLVRVDFDTLKSGIGSATIGPDDQPITASEARRIACDARIVPLVIGGRLEPLDIGRASRTVSTPFRRAVADRDNGCAFPGCAKQPPFCQVHHLVEWQHGGKTNTGNLALPAASPADPSLRLASTHAPRATGVHPTLFADPERKLRHNRISC